MFVYLLYWGKQVVPKPLWWVDSKEIRLERSTQLGPATDGDCSYIITQIGLVTPTRPGVILSSFLGPNFLNFPYSSSETQFVKMITNAKCQNLFSLSLSSQCRFSLPRSHWLYKHKLASANWWQAMRGGLIFQGFVSSKTRHSHISIHIRVTAYILLNQILWPKNGVKRA